jgi:hypothetical protein
MQDVSRGFTGDLTGNATAWLDITSRRAPVNVCGIVAFKATQGWRYADLFILTAVGILSLLILCAKRCGGSPLDDEHTTYSRKISSRSAPMTSVR